MPARERGGEDGTVRRSERGRRAAMVVAACLLLLGAGCGDERPGEEGPADTAAAAQPEPGERQETRRPEGPAGAEPSGRDHPYDFGDAQRRAVSDFLRDRPGWSLVTVEANTNRLLERWQEERPDYRPYFLEGDLTGDGEEDFAVVFDAGADWRVAWFRGTDGGFVHGEPVIRTDWLDRGGLFLQEGDLVLGEFYTDRLEIYRWDAERGRLVHHVPHAPELRGEG